MFFCFLFLVKAKYNLTQMIKIKVEDTKVSNLKMVQELRECTALINDPSLLPRIPFSGLQRKLTALCAPTPHHQKYLDTLKEYRKKNI